MLVLMEVSSMNTTLPGVVRMAGRRCLCHSSRSALTSARSFSDASNVFFIGETGPTQEFRQIGWINFNAALGKQQSRKFRHSDVGPLLYM